VVQKAILPNDLTGVVYVRVTDTNRTRGKKSLDTVYVDQLYILTD
jgi:hypothetical protein